MIPEAKQPAVERALAAAFGVSDYEDIRLLTGGLSTALAFRIVVNNKPYLLKILRAELIGNPAHEFACMQTAAQAGIAPRVWYANVEDRVLISDFVEAKPFPDDMGLRMAATLRKLHALRNFPKVVNYFDVIDSFIRRFQAAQILPESETDELFRRYGEVRIAYPGEDTELVASHNDLKPQNIAFDGEHIWLVDWESAFLNDPYVDLAIVANFFVNDEAQENSFLRAYFGEPAGEYRRARFYLVRQAVSMFYATLLLLEAAGAGLAMQNADPPASDFRAFHQGLIAGEIDVAQPNAKLQYGKLHLRQALQNMRSPRFEQAVNTLRKFHAAE